MAVANVKRDLREVEKVDGRAGADTLRLWESYRDQAYLWRALSLIQIPATFLSLLAALIMYYTADTVIEVPEKPLPGFYSVKQLPDAEFISVAEEVVNLISSYQYKGAREQFKSARKYLWEPALSQFERVMMEEELRTIEETARSQMFFIDPKQIKIERHPELDKVIVRLPGVRQKLIGQRALPPDELVYYVKMTTIPRNIHNEHGIVVIDIRLRVAPLALIRQEDKEEAKEKRTEQWQERLKNIRSGN
jgi:hypothetical protein